MSSYSYTYSSTVVCTLLHLVDCYWYSNWLTDLILPSQPLGTNRSPWLATCLGWWMGFSFHRAVRIWQSGACMSLEGILHSYCCTGVIGSNLYTKRVKTELHYVCFQRECHFFSNLTFTRHLKPFTSKFTPATHTREYLKLALLVSNRAEFSEGVIQPWISDAERKQNCSVSNSLIHLHFPDLVNIRPYIYISQTWLLLG